MWDWIAGTLPTPPPPQPRGKKKGKEGRLGHLTSVPDAALGLGVFNQGGLLWCHCPAHAWTFALEVTHIGMTWGHL